MFWHWRELMVTYSSELQGQIRDLLSETDIEYKIKTVNRTSPSFISPTRRSYTGTVGESNAMYEYLIYVKEKDYARACHLIKNR